MKGLSPWALSALKEIQHADQIFAGQAGAISLTLKITSDSVWASINVEANPPIHFRVCFIPAGKILDYHTQINKNEIQLSVESLIGQYQVSISLPSRKFNTLQYTTKLIPSSALFVPFWPRDILLQNNLSDAIKDFGEVHAVQRQTRSGLIYLSKATSKLRMLYFQNLSALSDYCEQTGTSLSGVVGGNLPELGLSLPPASEKPIKENVPIILSDAYICLQANYNDSSDQAIDYLNMLADIYVQLPRPNTHYRPWPKILKDGLKDLIENPGCWSLLGGNSYLNAYFCDYETPPEIMVQLAVLLPLIDYQEWSGEELDVIQTIRKGLPPFYSKKLETLLRWHPNAEDKLKGEEEQKKPMVMDSWYLHHPLLNLSRLALKGDEQAKQLFFDSVGFAIKVAHKFKYEWPVFYKMDTLEILKKETEPKKGGEHDVAGLYAHVMLQAYELSNEEKYLNEAIKAANKLADVGYEIMYQANNTAFAAGALLRLYKITGTEVYLNLSYRCLASIFQNVQLWDCNYGFGKNLPTFFALFPLPDAPYTAAYEEEEVFCALHDYLNHAIGIKILPSVKLLCGEYMRYLIDRAPFYYPPMLPEDMLSKEVKTGEVEKNLWIALEDLHDGIEQSGAVGQEVYGAGNAFGILPRHFIRVHHESFMVFIDGPFAKVSQTKNSIRFEMNGHSEMDYHLQIVFDEDIALQKRPSFQIKVGKEKFEMLKDKPKMKIGGDKSIHLTWHK